MTTHLKTVKGFQYTLEVKGIYGRKRKPQFECVTLRISEQALSIDEARELAMPALTSLKPKPGLQWKVVKHDHKTEYYQNEDGEIYSMGGVSFAIGVDSSILRGIVE